MIRGRCTSSYRVTLCSFFLIGLSLQVLVFVVFRVFRHNSQSIALNVSVPSDEKPSSLAFRQSFGFFGNIPDREWARFFQDNIRTSRYYENPDQPNDRSNNAAHWIFYNIEPSFNCPRVKRLGNSDGPKWTCDPDRLVEVAKRRQSQGQGNPCLVYSFGSAETLDWERNLHDVVGGSCEVHIFGSRKQQQSYPSTFRFHGWTIGIDGSSPATSSKPDSTFRSLQGTKERLGHQGMVIDILRVNCGGCEW